MTQHQAAQHVRLPAPPCSILVSNGMKGIIALWRPEQHVWTQTEPANKWADYARPKGNNRRRHQAAPEVIFVYHTVSSPLKQFVNPRAVSDLSTYCC